MKLKKELGFLDLFCVASGSMISSGLFVLPGVAYATIGPSVFVSYLIASILIIPAMLSKSELSTAMPKTGGTYFFIDRSMGPGIGTVAGISAWFSLCFKSAFALLGIGAFTTILFPELTMLQIKLIAAGCCVFFALVNFYSTKHAGSLQILLVVFLIILLIVYIATGFSKMNIENFSPFIKGESHDLFATAGLIFISYGGLTKITSLAEEVRNPSRNIPLAMVLSFVIVSIIYVLTVLVTVGVLGDTLLGASGTGTLTPITEGAEISMGKFGLVIMAVAAMLAFISTGNAGIMTASRQPIAMSRDDLLPDFFKQLHEKFQTPRNSIIVTTTFMLCIILFLDLKTLVKTASTIMILLFISVNAAVIIMRESGLQNYRPTFKSPFYPWPQIIGILTYIALLIDMGKIPLMITGFFLLTGVIWYLVYGRIHTNRVSALVHLVRRITAKELDSQVLNSELKEIIQERDEIVEDQFDQLVKRAIVIDLVEEKPYEELFSLLSEQLSDKLDLDKDDVYERFMKREKESSTVLAPQIAVPHVILKGESLFEMILVRSAQGIKFPTSQEPVHAMFVLAGTLDERNHHLRTLMSIAQLLQSGDFLDRWLKASNEQQLRDLLLLGERTRQTPPIFVEV